MLPAPTYIVSDLHLGAAPEETERAFLAFLRTVAERAGALVINGDLFEFWFEWRHVIPRGSFRVLAALSELRERGLPVVLVAGNHDCWGGEILRDDVGVDFTLKPLTTEVAGWRTRIEHGDGLREVEDRKYRRLRTVLRHPMSIRAFRWLHPDLGSRLAHGSSHASRAYGAKDQGRGLRAVAASVLAESPELDVVVYGHSHVAALERLPSGGVYANAGSWLVEPTYLVVTPERIALRRWTGDGSAEGVDLHVLDRVAKEALP